MMTNPIRMRLLLSATEISMDQREAFQIGIEVTNTSGEALDPQLSTATLYVDDKRSAAWDLALGNGGFPTSWASLPPNETISTQWALGPELFAAPGTYAIRLNLGFANEGATLRVMTPQIVEA